MSITKPPLVSNLKMIQTIFLYRLAAINIGNMSVRCSEKIKLRFFINHVINVVSRFYDLFFILFICTSFTYTYDFSRTCCAHVSCIRKIKSRNWNSTWNNSLSDIRNFR